MAKNKLKIKQFCSFLLSLLVLTMPFAYAQILPITSQEAIVNQVSQLGFLGDNVDLGQSIIVNVANYKPSQIRQSLLEQQNVPVFIYLKGTTIGTLLSSVSDDPSQRDPLSGITNIPPIKAISITPINLSRDFIASTRYVPPEKNYYTLSNLGYLIVNLKRLTNFSSLSTSTGLFGTEGKTIDLQMQANILFDLQQGSLFGISEQQRTIDQVPDDDQFYKKDLSPYSILGGRAYVRATELSDNTGVFKIYDKSKNPISVFSPALGSNEAGISPTSVIRITIGQTSNKLSLGQYSDPYMDTFRIRLDRIVAPQDSADLEITANGQTVTRTYRLGDKLTSTSSWTLTEIYQEESRQATSADLTKFHVTSGTTSVPVTDLKVVTYKIKIYNTKTSSSFDLTSKRLISGTDFIDTTEDLTDESASILEQKYCPPPITTTPATTTSTTAALEPACQSIILLKQLIAQHPSAKETPEAYFTLGQIYQDQLILWERNGASKNLGPCDPGVSPAICKAYQIDMKNLAGYYYNRAALLDPSRAEEARKKLLEKYNANSPPAYLEDDAFSVTLSSTKKVSEKDKGSAKIKIGNCEPRQFFLNQLLSDCDGKNIVSYDSSNPPKPTYYRITGISATNVQIEPTSNPATFLQSITSAITSTATSVINRVPYASSVFGLQSKNLVIGERDALEIYSQTRQQGQPPSQLLPIEVIELDSKKEAQITILPGLTTGTVQTNFTIHIPVEPRPFSYTPDELNKKINATNDLIKKMDSVITKLDSLTTKWKRTCLVTFGILTVKNSLLQGTSRNIARKEVSSFFKQKCANDVSLGRYSTKLECYDKYSTNITNAINLNQKAIDAVNVQLKGKSLDDLRGPNKDTAFANFEKVGGSIDQYRDHLRYQELLKTSSSTITDPAYVAEIKKQTATIDYSRKITLFTDSQKFATTYATTVPASSSFTSSASYQTAVSDAYIKLNNSKNADKDTLTNLIPIDEPNKKYQAVVKDPTTGRETIVDITRVTPLQKAIADAGSINLFLEQLVKDKIAEVNSITGETTATRVDTDVKNRIASYIKNLNNDVAKDSNGNDQYVLSTEIQPKSLAGTAAEYEDYLRDALIPGATTPSINILQKGKATDYYKTGITTYADKLVSSNYGDTGKILAQYDNDGRAYCYPTDINGNYVMILERYQTGAPKTMRYLNVGANGVIDCGRGDDVLIKSESELGLSENRGLYNTILNIASRAPTCQNDGDKVATLGKYAIICSKNQFLTDTQLQATECIDTMDPADCKILFNVCDPVMCPSSRCNLGGRYTPKGGVISSGLVGSTILCMPNFPEVVVPVCLTGIDSSLKAYRSILQGYSDCLSANLKDGSNVGICDYINSIGICEIMWKEASFILDLKGGVLNWLTEKTLGQPQGGSEYLTFQSALDNVGQSVQAFTKEYSDTRLSALYQGKSSEEFGSEVCRMSINGKLPSVGQILDQLSQPEDPPQFYAFFDSTDYVGDAGDVRVPGLQGTYGAQELTQYSIFYHIYAGTGYPSDTSLASGQSTDFSNNPIRYSVFLRNKEDGSVLYVTTNPTEYGQDTKAIERGAFAQQSIQTVAKSGFNEICVTINGRLECGFGKVSTDLALKLASDALIGDESQRRDIKSAEECIPDSGKTSPSLGSISTPINFGLLSTGVSRICSLQSPTTETTRWVNVGTCGKDSNGLDLGICWLDSNSLNFEDATKKPKVLKALNLSSNAQTQALALSGSKAAQILLTLNEQRNRLIEVIEQAYKEAMR